MYCCTIMTRKYKLLIENLTQVVQITNNRARSLTKEDMKQVAVLVGNPGGYSVLVGSDGRIVDIGRTNEMKEQYSANDVDFVIDGSGKCLLPGLVDAHTHPVWAGDRVHEFAMKLAGATYMDVHKMGGGINFTVNHTRLATEDALFASFSSRLRQMVQAGTTLVECKSGYGLDFENEAKMLRVIERAKLQGQADISSTYCGAHAIPKGVTAEDAIHEIINKHIPGVIRMKNSNEAHVDSIDVFCEQGVFDVAQTKRIIQAGKEAGLQINFHSEQLQRLGSAEMGAQLGARALSHLEEVSDAGIEAMAASGTAAIILPTTAYNLRLKSPPIRKMIDQGVIVALGSDFNPNAHCSSMPLVMNLACVMLNMSMPEALIAATLNAAYSLGKSDTHGSIEVGKVGNLVLVDAPSWEHLIYQMGNHSNIISMVIWRGNVVYRKP